MLLGLLKNIVNNRCFSSSYPTLQLLEALLYPRNQAPAALGSLLLVVMHRELWIQWFALGSLNEVGWAIFVSGSQAPAW